MQEFKVASDDVGQRLDIFVAARYPQFSRSSLERLFEMDMIKLNAKAAKPSNRVKPADVIAVDEQYLKSEPPQLKLPVIFKNNDVIVVDKPAGILSHAKGDLNLEPTVASFIRKELNDKRMHGNRAGIIHRLDRQTSGVIVTARNQNSLKYIQKQFSNRKVKKVYTAVAEGKVEPPEAIIDAPISRNPRRPQTFLVRADGKPAITRYKVQKRLIKNGKDYTLLELNPETGRTHQLRVHMAYIDHPIVGDPVYGMNGMDLLLHASKIELTLPGGIRKIFKAPLPARIKDFIKP